MTRITLRLPDALYDRMRASARRRGASLNQTIVETLQDAVETEERCADENLPLDEQVRRVRDAVDDDVIEIDPAEWLKALGLSHVVVPPDRPLPLPVLDPPLSQTIIEEREEHRF